jgi:hypothetical protein
MDVDWGGLKVLGFFGLIMTIVVYDIIKTRREIAADKRAATHANPVGEPNK